MRVNAKKDTTVHEAIPCMYIPLCMTGPEASFILSIFFLFFDNMSKFQVHPYINDCHVKKSVIVAFSFLIMEYIILARAVYC